MSGKNYTFHVCGLNLLYFQTTNIHNILLVAWRPMQIGCGNPTQNVAENHSQKISKMMEFTQNKI